MDKTSTQQYVRRAKVGAESRIGKVALNGRYLKKRLEDDFELGEELGSGFNGCVYSARCRHTGIRYAVKQLHLHGMDKETKQQLAGELSVSLSLDHPNIARLHRAYEADGAVSLVMECLSGGELYDRIQEKKIFEEHEAQDAIRQMLLAINYLHHEGVTHRDLKLENFLYDATGSDCLKLIDFGFSKYCTGQKMKEALGTLPYAAPEVLRRNYSGGSCDMWSLGCTAFTLLCGHMPFSASDDEALVAQICQGKYRKKKDRWQALSSNARDFLEKLLVVEPAGRMTAKQALAHPFISERLSKEESALEESSAQAFVSLILTDEFTRAILKVMSWSLTSDERRKLQDKYAGMGLSQDGIVELRELKRIFQELNMKPSWLSLVMCRLEALDVQGRGELHYSDFLAAMMARKLEQGEGDAVEEMLKATFRRLDERGAGYISADSLSSVGVGSISDDIRRVFDQKFLAVPGRMTVEEFLAYLYQPQATQSHSPLFDRAEQPRWKRALGKLVPSCLSMPRNFETPRHIARAGA